MKQRERLGKKWPIIIMIISAALVLFADLQLLLYYSNFREESVLDEHLQSIRSRILAEDSGDMQTYSEDYGDVQMYSEDYGDVQIYSGKTAQERAKQAMTELAAINSDYIGWLTLEGTEISYPIVHRDKEYYLNHDFEQKENRHGAIFLDGSCDAEFPVWLIHGHHMKDGTMFGGLKYFEKADYLQEHTTLYFDAGDGDEKYRIYAAALIDFSDENDSFRPFHYEELPLTSETFSQWQNNLKQYSYWYDTECENLLEDISETLVPRGVLVLSTCEYGTDLQRLIVVAVRVEEAIDDAENGRS